MSRPKVPDPVKLVASLFSPHKAIIDRMVDRLSELFGPVDQMSGEFFFDRTRYYEKEMGWPLKRVFVSLQEPVMPERLVKIKLQTNELEQETLKEGNRLVNIDPGILSHERLILATGKNYVHRVYLSRGIYADLALVFRNRSFRPLEWTYPDYRDEQVVGFFNRVREIYVDQIREMKRIA